MRPAFTLLHGTWAPQAPWTRPDSALCRRLRERFGSDTSIESVGWSGWNRVSTRTRGAQRLADHLRSQPLHDGQQHFVIGHSHGGNVALYALREPDVAARVCGVVTLATPFLVARRRTFEARLTGVFAMLMVPVVLAMLAFSGVIADRFGSGWAAWSVFFAVLAGLGFGLAFTIRRWSAFRERVFEAMRFGPIARERLLIMRSPADEASIILLATRALLAVGTIVFTLLAQLYGTFDRMMQRARQRPWLRAGAVVATLAVWLALLWLLQWHGRFDDTGGMALAVVLGASGLLLLMPMVCELLDEPEAGRIGWFYLLAAALLATAVLPSLLLVLYGWQLAVANLALDVSAESTPLGDWRVVTIAPTTAFGDDRAPLLTHSALYDDPRAIELLCDWVDDVLAGLREPTPDAVAGA